MRMIISLHSYQRLKSVEALYKQKVHSQYQPISQTQALYFGSIFSALFLVQFWKCKKKNNRKKEKKKGETISSFEILPSVLLNYYILRNNIPTFVLTHFPLRLLGLQNQDHVLNISEYSLEFDTASAGEQTQSCQ